MRNRPLGRPKQDKGNFDQGRLAAHIKTAIVPTMSTVAEIETAIEKLSPAEQRELADRLNDRLFEETPAMLVAIDEGIRSLETEGGREYTRAELEQKVRQWAHGVSR